MEFEIFIEVGNLVFQKITEIGNLSWAVSTWEKTGQKPKTAPPHRGGASLFIASIA